jgi:hypothetical protein
VRSPNDSEPFLSEIPAGWEYSLAAEPATGDAEGRYRLAILPWSSNGVLVARCAGFAKVERAVLAVGAPGSIRIQDFRLNPTGSTKLSGLVRLNGLTLKALCGTIAWRGPTHSGSAPFVDGRYEVFVEPGAIALTATAMALRERPAEFQVALLENEQRIFDLDFSAPTGSIRGSVRLRNGEPLRDVLVQATCALPLAAGDGLWHSTRTDVLGAFELAVADLGLTFDLSARSPLGQSLVRERVAVGAEHADFTFESAYRFRLRVVEGGTGGALSPGRDFDVCRGTWSQGLGPGDADGWSVGWSERREIELLIVPQGEFAERLAPRRIRLDLERDPPDVEVRLDAGHKVTLALEPPLTGASHGMWIVEEGLHETAGRRQRGPFAAFLERRFLRFDEQGRAEQRGLAPGRYHLVVEPADLELDPEILEVGEGDVSVAVRWREMR